MDELIGKIIKDNETGDIGRIIKWDGTFWKGKTRGYYLIRWIFVETKSHHYVKNKKEFYAKYTEDNIKRSGRFEFLTGEESFLYML